VARALPALRESRFRRLVAPMAPWVFAAPAIAFGLLPSVVGADRATDGIALTAVITMLCAVAGVLIQPVARRLESGAHGNLAGTAGLLVMVVGLLLAALAAQLGQIWLLVPTVIVLGGGYGLCLEHVPILSLAMAVLALLTAAWVRLQEKRRPATA
jgi:hypothetical protein